MKRIIAYLAIAVIALSVAACDKEQREVRREQKRLKKEGLTYAEQTQPAAAQMQSDPEIELGAQIRLPLSGAEDLLKESVVDPNTVEKLSIAEVDADAAAAVAEAGRTIDKIAVSGKLKVEKIEDVVLNGLTSCSIKMRVNNSTAYNLSLYDGNANVYYNGSKVGTIVLDHSLAIQKKCTASVVADLSFHLENAITALSVVNKLRRGDTENISVDIDAMFGVGNRKQQFTMRGVPLDSVLSAAGVNTKK